MTQKMALIKTAFFALLGPGTVTVLVPYLLAREDIVAFDGALSAAHLAGAVLAFCGALLGLWSAGLFATVGKGTPAPIDPPKDLVAVGAYRFVRNPMYVGVASILLGEALFFKSWNLLAYALVVIAAFIAFVHLYEEPVLRRKFGKAYEDYCRQVGRWLPKPPSH